MRRAFRTAFAALCCFLLLGASSTRAAESDFPRTPEIAEAVAFWTAIFAERSRYQLTVHDPAHPNLVLEVLDYRPVAAKGLGASKLRKEIRTRSKAALTALKKRLREIHAKRKAPESLSPADRKIFDLYAAISDDQKFAKASRSLRTQSGLRESFIAAIGRSGRYLSEMEEIFRRAKLPIELTRLPFVESSFDSRAYSKVGAAGMWQFIPSSARMYMRLDETADDRRDPYFSTEAAAKHLTDDFAALGHWPLAVTAYNHGRAGMARAVRKAGSTDLATIIRKYKSRTWGFASKNFYAEFLAAMDVYRDRVKHFGEVERDKPVPFELVRLDHYVPFAKLAAMAGMTKKAFHELNPAWHDSVVAGRLHVPAKARVRLPEGRSGAFRTAYAKLGPKERFTRQQYRYAKYKVRNGDTLSGIAERHGTSSRRLQQLNGLRSAHRIRIGQMLKVPGGGVAAKDAWRPQRTKRHRVRRGQTVERIARLYGTTISKIQRANGLRNPHAIRAGQVLKIPSP